MRRGSRIRGRVCCIVDNAVSVAMIFGAEVICTQLLRRVISSGLRPTAEVCGIGAHRWLAEIEMCICGDGARAS